MFGFGKTPKPEPEAPMHATAVPTSAIIAKAIGDYVNSQNSFYSGFIQGYLPGASVYVEKVLIKNGRLPADSK
jgi:hypothetical protein